MKNTLIALAVLLASCAKKESTPAPAPTPSPTTKGQFTATTGTFVITPVGAPSYTLSNLKRKVEAVADASGTVITSYYTWRGITPASTGIEIETAYVYRSGSSSSLPWAVNVVTRTADANFTQLKALDATGKGTISAAGQGVALVYSGKLVSGALTQ